MIINLKKYFPILILIIVGYCPFIGESFKLKFSTLPIFFYLLAIIIILNYKKIINSNFLSYFDYLLLFYIGTISIFGLIYNKTYLALIDIMPFVIFYMGNAVGYCFSRKINIQQWFIILAFLIVLIFFKILLIESAQFELRWDGSTFFSAAMGPEIMYFHRVIMKGEMPFLLIPVLTITTILLDEKLSSVCSKNLLILIFLISIFCILSNYTRSLMLATFISIFVNFCFKKIKMMKFSISISVILITLILFIYYQDIYKYIRTIIGINYRINEAIAAVKAVNRDFYYGLLPGAEFAYIGSDIGPNKLDNYVHFLPIWLYLKGGIVLVILFYTNLIDKILKIINILNIKNSSEEILIISILIGLFFLDIMTNQFATISGAFYLGFFSTFKIIRSDVNVNVVKFK